ncbi:hypothetical protein IFR05_003957 [Cadophora sp. M221]|nr:hypothetical protein IFR05_003957 [Cadophora sp. M221]
MSAGRTPSVVLASSVALHVVAISPGEVLRRDTRPLVAIQKLPVLHGGGSATMALRPGKTLSLGNNSKDDKHKEAAFAQERGIPNIYPCVQCEHLQNTGIWVVCVSLPGFFGKSCCNCRWANEANHCSCHKRNMGLITETMQSRPGISTRVIKLTIAQAPGNLRDWLNRISTVSQESYYKYFGPKICLEALRQTQPDNPIFQAWVPVANKWVQADQSGSTCKLNPFTKAIKIQKQTGIYDRDAEEVYEIAAEGSALIDMLLSERKTYWSFMQNNYLFRSLLPDHQNDVQEKLRDMMDSKYTAVVQCAMDVEHTELPDFLRLPADPEFPQLTRVGTGPNSLKLYNRTSWGLQDVESISDTEKIVDEQTVDEEIDGMEIDNEETGDEEISDDEEIFDEKINGMEIDDEETGDEKSSGEESGGEEIGDEESDDDE